ncbi:fasciclin domain-containing protein [Flagellimonas allohymeniacidonis]|uniref:Fasciclin domain-containing protein n=1 Tax=Flagellimonas allohymeniacidonis TaxID=2517819 RepID=A0A4V2HST5_9FLAO|nr:fasciclin domain-containing protein [Allomuricauda hymeniacidonis]TAI49030.1 fasciclin domain-containing protein [Allomuricauda hymeniacidonis]
MKMTPTISLLALLCMGTLSSSAQYQKKETLSVTAESERHSTLFAAVKAVEMDDILEGSGPFTIFAPSNAAFEKFSSAKLKELMSAKDKSELKSLLTYHIVAGNLTASRILRALCRGKGRASFTTVQGKKLTAHMEGYDIVLTDPVGNTARITHADLSHGNRVIHEIDSVILPAQM